MTEHKIDIRSGNPFPWHFLLLGVFIFCVGAFMMPERPAISLVLIFASGFILSSSSGTEVDKLKNRYREYLSFYFILKNGKWKKFNGAEKVFINSSKIKAVMHPTHMSLANPSSVFKYDEFNAYLKLVDGTKIHLASNTKKEKLVSVSNRAASFLKCPLQDNTNNEG